MGSFKAKRSSPNQNTALPKYGSAADKIQSSPYSIPKTQLV
jgi:hypothetical protein